MNSCLNPNRVKPMNTNERAGIFTVMAEEGSG